MNQKAMARQLAVIHDIERPNIDDIVKEIFTDFIELHGDRLYGEDHAMCAGIARLNSTPVTVIGQRKGHTTEQNIEANFGMAHPEGYRKALPIGKAGGKVPSPDYLFCRYRRRVLRCRRRGTRTGRGHCTQSL